ncbi:excalibur calcium-binding domain-containing protein [Lysobacter niastensis]|uniref:excalibur calcium-binding domain-containing protein n=1 Tax=Lysobacter niastensis TaxID=380629 RepID=UPI003D2F808E
MSGVAYGHGGGLNKDGCHNNRQAGDYHCHRSGSARSAPATSKSLGPSDSSPNRSTGGRRSFANCTEALSVGAAPVMRGDPGYGPHLDRDNDGVGCESYRGRR